MFFGLQGYRRQAGPSLMGKETRLKEQKKRWVGCGAGDLCVLQG